MIGSNRKHGNDCKIATEDGVQYLEEINFDRQSSIASSNNGGSIYRLVSSRKNRTSVDSDSTAESLVSTSSFASVSSQLSNGNSVERDYSIDRRKTTNQVIGLIKGGNSKECRRSSLLSNTTHFLQENLQDMKTGALLSIMNSNPPGKRGSAFKRMEAISELLEVTAENLINTEVETVDANSVEVINDVCSDNTKEWIKDTMLFNLNQIVVFISGSSRLQPKDTKTGSVARRLTSAGLSVVNTSIPAPVNVAVDTGLQRFFEYQEEKKINSAIINLDFPNEHEIIKFSEILSEMIWETFPQDALSKLRTDGDSKKIYGFFKSISSAFYNFASHNSFSDVFSRKRGIFSLFLEDGKSINQYKNNREILYSYAFLECIKEIISTGKGKFIWTKENSFAKDHQRQIYKFFCEELCISGDDIHLEMIKHIIPRLDSVKTSSETVEEIKTQVESCHLYLQEQESMDKFQNMQIDKLGKVVYQQQASLNKLNSCQDDTLKRLSGVQEELRSTGMRIKGFESKLDNVETKLDRITEVLEIVRGPALA